MANYTLATLPSKFAIGDTITFSYTGAIQNFPLLNQKNIKVECYGGQGGNSVGTNWNGSALVYPTGIKGNYLSASLKQNIPLDIYVGGQGGSGWSSGSFVLSYYAGVS